MDITWLEKGLTFCGRVQAVKQTCYVFDALDYFFVMSFSESKSNAGNFNVVRKDAVRYVHKRFAGQKDVTSKVVVERARRSPHVPDTQVALNVLYVLVAIGAAQIQKIGSHQQLFFRVLKRSV